MTRVENCRCGTVSLESDGREGVMFDLRIPSPKKHSARFMWKLVTTWIAMGFRVRKVD